jgi:hypothetical protein
LWQVIVKSPLEFHSQEPDTEFADSCGFGCTFHSPRGRLTRSLEELQNRGGSSSNPRTAVGPPFTDVQSAAIDHPANPPKLKATASVFGFAPDMLAFAFFAIT